MSEKPEPDQSEILAALLRQLYERFVGGDRLGAEFEAIWDANRDKLYEN